MKLEEIVFDIEVYPEWWCIVFSNTKGEVQHIITSDTKDFVGFLKRYRIGRVFIGFNIKGYDLRILNAIIHGCDTNQIYELSLEIVETRDNFNTYNNYYFWREFNFSDLYDDWRGSLKEFESNIGMSIEECPVPFDKRDLTKEEIDEIIKYCIHDVDATVRLLEHRREYINVKKALTKTYNIRLDVAYKSTNAKLTSMILKAKKQNRPKEYKYIFPSNVKEYLEATLPKHVLDMFRVLDDETHTLKLFDNEVTFGSGGIHSSYGSNIHVESDENNILFAADGTGYYQKLMIVYGYLSRNVENPEDYEKIYNGRVALKKIVKDLKKKGITEEFISKNQEQLGLKLVLNTTYGAAKNQYNALYDPDQATRLCYLGQLLLAALSNVIHNRTKGKIIQTNTDGIYVFAPRKEYDKIKKIISHWEKITNINMEYVEIKKFIQRDVNNYIEIHNDNSYKIIGEWVKQAKRDYYGNWRGRIASKAILDYYISGKSIRETIYESNDPMDFIFTCKTGYTYDKTFYHEDGKYIKVNKVNRVVATTNKKHGSIYKYKKLEEKMKINSENSPYYYKDMKKHRSWLKRQKNSIRNFKEKTNLNYGRLDKVSNIPEHCLIMNNNLYIPDTLDREWYIKYTEGKLVDLRRITI